MEKEYGTEQELVHTIESQQMLLSALHRTHQEQWHAHYLDYSSHIPSLAGQPFITQRPAISSIQKNIDTEQFAKTMHDILVHVLKGSLS